MRGSFVVLTGASGSGKTTLVNHLRQTQSGDCEFFCFDTIGVPPVEEMLAKYGNGHQPGGAWQRAMTLQWVEKAVAALATGRSVLFEGQMRIAFIDEALKLYRIEGAKVILVDCDDATRTARLHGPRAQPELADANMMGWAQYLREEAAAAGYEILDSGAMPFDSAVRLISQRLGIPVDVGTR